MISICLGCSKEFTPHRKSFGMFCSNQCQQNLAFQKRYDDWVSGKIETSPNWLRRALVRRDGQMCAVCCLTEWRNNPITLELDHIDGSYSNNETTNLRLICPNCHSQTMTYKNRNHGNGRPYRRKTHE